MAWFRIALSPELLEIVVEERLGLATVQRLVAAFRDEGLDGVRRWNVTGPTSDLAAFPTRRKWPPS